MINQIETIIIGAGQAGLAISYWLNRAGLEHLVLEKATRPAPVWSEERWDSFTLVTPNWAFLLPGAEYRGAERNGFMSKTDVVRTFENYVLDNRLPIQYGEEVTAVEADGSRYLVKGSSKSWRARNVVVATGAMRIPRIPPYAQALNGDILQLTASQYRNTHSLPPGGVLVVGSGQSGCQIADELLRSGRNVTLSTGGTGRVPRRYRDKDIVEWLIALGFFDRTIAQIKSPGEKFSSNPHLSGRDGGKSLNLHQFAREGMQLVGRISGAQDGRLILEANLHENLRRSDRFESEIITRLDEMIEKRGYTAPQEERAVTEDGFNCPEITTLPLKEARIGTIIWAQGFKFDYSLVKLPVLDPDGYPESMDFERFPGLFFAGLPWLPKFKSGLLMGVGEDSALIALRIAKRHKED